MNSALLPLDAVPVVQSLDKGPCLLFRCRVGRRRGKPRCQCRGYCARIYYRSNTDIGGSGRHQQPLGGLARDGDKHRHKVFFRRRLCLFSPSLPFVFRFFGFRLRLSLRGDNAVTQWRMKKPDTGLWAYSVLETDVSLLSNNGLSWNNRFSHHDNQDDQGGKQPATSNQQPATSNQQPATSNLHPTTTTTKTMTMTMTMKKAAFTPRFVLLALRLAATLMVSSVSAFTASQFHGARLATTVLPKTTTGSSTTQLSMFFGQPKDDGSPGDYVCKVCRCVRTQEWEWAWAWMYSSICSFSRIVLCSFKRALFRGSNDVLFCSRWSFRVLHLPHHTFIRTVATSSRKDRQHGPSLTTNTSAHRVVLPSSGSRRSPKDQHPARLR